ncbi:MAG TPA: serine protease [Deltaproteobacteria bacterium]|nr:serine protease [Candidatus Lambdaproteobacteria bacterium]HIA56499.1 serine protease [Candidatus Lambdaproteobacteria bacterium]HIN47384.1 serine protease [Deltaproteobacteria bacterium]HIO10967.1 serine protease [Deltaproteobacteria bacterium]HIO60800.1 serine protease [Deltaproteobacteria bacterium]
MFHSKAKFYFVLVCLWNAALTPVLASPDKIEQSVFRITNYQQSPNWQSPWKMKPTNRGLGSGFLIQDNLILTNAHVVSDSRILLVNKISNPEPFLADVVAIAHDSDLALLKVRDANFYQDLTPLELGGIPELRSRVRAYGYPMGGQELSRTEGVVSRIEFGTYVHPGIDSHLLIQTDSAINPGNSGGPVTQSGRAIGVAFQSNLRLNDVGYFIPVPLITRFLSDIEDGKYEGVPEIGIETSSLVNRHYRRYLGLPENTSGILVDRVIPHSSADGVILSGDVLTKIEDKQIDAAGMVRYGEQQVTFFIEAENRQIGDLLKIQVWRKGKFHNLSLSLKAPPFGAEMRNSYDELPEYLIFGGLVFIALNRNYIHSPGNLTPSLAYEHWYRELERPRTRRDQVILISRVLPSSVNSGYSNLRNFIVTTLNGKSVNSLRDLDIMLKEMPPDTLHVVFESEWQKMPLVLDYKKSLEQQQSVLERYGILRSSNLSALQNKDSQ